MSRGNWGGAGGGAWVAGHSRGLAAKFTLLSGCRDAKCGKIGWLGNGKGAVGPQMGNADVTGARLLGHDWVTATRHSRAAVGAGRWAGRGAEGGEVVHR